jgi:hypothetical protein
MGKRKDTVKKKEKNNKYISYYNILKFLNYFKLRKKEKCPKK